jgi:hypothetical protein
MACWPPTGKCRTSRPGQVLHSLISQASHLPIRQSPSYPQAVATSVTFTCCSASPSCRPICCQSSWLPSTGWMLTGMRANCSVASCANSSNTRQPTFPTYSVISTAGVFRDPNLPNDATWWAHQPRAHWFLQFNYSRGDSLRVPGKLGKDFRFEQIAFWENYIPAVGFDIPPSPKCSLSHSSWSTT